HLGPAKRAWPAGQNAGMEIEGAVALVTGGASGLGRATAEHLHAAGAAVVIVDLPSSGGGEVADQLGKRAAFAPGDVTSEEDVTSALDVAAGLGRLSAVVNCAGVAPSIRVVGKRGTHPLNDFTRAVMVNLVGTFNVIRLAAARMVEDPGDPGVE